MPSRVRFRVVSSTRMCPPVARPDRRAAVFTVSPITVKPAASSEGATITSPEFTPAWISGSWMPLRSRFRTRTRSRTSSAARTARSASSSCATGTPKIAMKPSPCSWGTVPP